MGGGGTLLCPVFGTTGFLMMGIFGGTNGRNCYCGYVNAF